MQLPTTTSKAKSLNPRKLFIYSHAKRGKTSAIAQLKNCLLIDLQSGASFVEGMIVDVVEESLVNSKHPLDILLRVEKLLCETDFKYDYICIDTASQLEDLAIEMGTRTFKMSSLGKNSQGVKDVTRELANGAGYAWVREAFIELINRISRHAVKCFILTGHSKLVSSGKKEDALDVMDVNLTGKIKHYVLQEFDANATGIREGNKFYLNFQTSEENLAMGNRSPHLSNQKVLISEMTELGLQTYWDKVFIDEPG